MGRILLLLPLIWPLLSCAASPRQESDPPEDRFERAAAMQQHLRAADLARQAGDFDTTIAELEEAQKIDPEHPEVLYRLGTSYAGAGRYKEALATLSELLEVSGDDPNRHKAHGQIALVYLRLQDLPEARYHFEKVVEIHPASATALYFLARLTYDQGDYAASLAYIDAFRRIVSAQNIDLLSEKERADLRRALDGLALLEASIQRQANPPE